MSYNIVDYRINHIIINGDYKRELFIFLKDYLNSHYIFNIHSATFPSKYYILSYKCPNKILSVTHNHCNHLYNICLWEKIPSYFLISRIKLLKFNSMYLFSISLLTKIIKIIFTGDFISNMYKSNRCILLCCYSKSINHINMKLTPDI